MWGRSSAPAEVVEERVKLPVYVLGLASASFAFGGKYHRPGSTSVMPQISPAFGNCDVKMSQAVNNPCVTGWRDQGQRRSGVAHLRPRTGCLLGGVKVCCPVPLGPPPQSLVPGRLPPVP